MPHNHPGHVQLRDDGVHKFLPGHTHHMAVKVDKDHIVYAKAAADDILPVDGAVDQRHFLAEHQVVRVHVKAENRGHGPDLGRPLLCLVEKGGVTHMHAVKKAQGYGSFTLCHGSLYLEKTFYGFQPAFGYLAKQQKLSAFRIDPVLPLPG